MTSTNRDAARETLQALFSAAVVAQQANEPDISTGRLVASLLRTRSVREFCLRANLDPGALVLAADDPISASYETHRRVLELRPLAPPIKQILDPVVEQHGAIAISPLELLRQLFGSDPELAKRFEPFSLHVMDD